LEFTLRDATLEDAAQLANLLRVTGWWAHIAAESPQETIEHVTRHLALDLADDSHTVYVAEGPDGRIAGYAAVHWLPYLFMRGPEGNVSELFVHEALRGQGVGKLLLQAVVSEARRRGCTRLSLINMRHRESYERGFYTKLGWEERPIAANFVYYLEPAPGIANQEVSEQ
jgi:GNAT superfamily N-acetyltransferase